MTGRPETRYIRDELRFCWAACRLIEDNDKGIVIFHEFDGVMILTFDQWGKARRYPSYPDNECFSRPQRS
jgi:hypothetical protein